MLRWINSGGFSLFQIGIVGRTGAGKFSVALALFRIMEASEGSITVDDVDISKVLLKRLRESISIIPQVRNNFLFLLKKYEILYYGVSSEHGQHIYIPCTHIETFVDFANWNQIRQITCFSHTLKTHTTHSLWRAL